MDAVSLEQSFLTVGKGMMKDKRIQCSAVCVLVFTVASVEAAGHCDLSWAGIELSSALTRCQPVLQSGSLEDLVKEECQAWWAQTLAPRMPPSAFHSLLPLDPGSRCTIRLGPVLLCLSVFFFKSWPPVQVWGGVTRRCM